MRGSNKSKVGIITMYYNSSNYGGVLQAYALTKAINKFGIEAEQIRYNHFSAYRLKKRLKIKALEVLPLIKHPSELYLYRQIKNRSRTIKTASELLVPHSEKVYSEKSIRSVVNEYSCFITGSDQVWHGEWPAYFLNFVPSDKRKISYAASFGKTELSKDDIDRIKGSTKDYYCISVREIDSAKQLSEVISDKKIEVVLDPTLVLDKSDWDSIASDRRIQEPYLFCYYLGNDKRMRHLAREYAQQNGLKIVSIPHMQGMIEKNDIGFGDIQIFDATPQDFVSFIKNSQAVFTDSFHASVFSQIYEKQYVIFSRAGRTSMNNRMTTFTELFNSQKRFVCNDEDYSLSKLKEICNLSNSVNTQKFYSLKDRSLKFIENALK